MGPKRAESGEEHPPDIGLGSPLLAFGGVLVLLFVWRTRHCQRANRDGRTTAFGARLRRHILYAALCSVRHSREFRLFGWIHMGNVPLRLEAMLVLGYVALNLTLIFVLVDWDAGFKGKMHQLQYSAAQMTVMNLPGLVLTAGRNNPLVPLLGIPFDTFNFVHRWIGRTVAVEAVAHMGCVVASMVHHHGLERVTHVVWHERFFVAGLVALIGFVSISIQASSPLRHAFYELFLHLHITLAVMAFVGLWYHLRHHPQQHILLAAVILWGCDRAGRLVNLLWRNCGSRRTTATVELLTGSVARVDVAVARPWTFKPGQYMYLYIPTLGLWTSHPFSVAWTSADAAEDAEKCGSSGSFNAVLGSQRSAMSFLIKGRDGFTRKLLRKAEGSAEGRATVAAFAEGPFGGLHSLASYGTVVLMAGGVGITHPMSYLHEYVHGTTGRAVATRRVKLIWVIKSLDHISWIQPWMASIHSLPPGHSLHIQIYITASTEHDTGDRTQTQKEPPVSISYAKPSLERIMQSEKTQQIGAMAVSVCGPGGLSDEVRRVVREAQGGKTVDFYEASFSW